MPFRDGEHASPITGRLFTLQKKKRVHRRGSEVIFTDSYSMPNSHPLRLAGIFRKSYSLRLCLYRFILFIIYFITKFPFCQDVFSCFPWLTHKIYLIYCIRSVMRQSAAPNCSPIRVSLVSKQRKTARLILRNFLWYEKRQSAAG